MASLGPGLGYGRSGADSGSVPGTITRKSLSVRTIHYQSKE